MGSTFSQYIYNKVTHKDSCSFLIFENVTMGSFDGAEICELVGRYILNMLNRVLHIVDPNDLGLYRDDGVAVVRNKSKNEANAIAKRLTAEFSKTGLRITTQSGVPIANFLDITLNLTENSNRPLRET